MATYSEIQGWLKRKFGYTVKTCWIADVKAQSGLEVRVAPNRKSKGKRKYPCPLEKRAGIEDALHYFKMI